MDSPLQFYHFKTETIENRFYFNYNSITITYLDDLQCHQDREVPNEIPAFDYYNSFHYDRIIANRMQFTFCNCHFVEFKNEIATPADA